VDGGLVESESFKNNYFIYKSVGGRTDVKGKEKKRKWWCFYLCKRRVNKDAERITISNTYYAEVATGVFAELPAPPRTCNNTSSCEQKEYAFGAGVKLKFPDGGVSPSTIDDLLPVDGVITRHEILVDGRPIVAVTSKGKHPPSPQPIIE